MSNWVDDFGFNAVDVMPTTEVKIDSSHIKDDVVKLSHQKQRPSVRDQRHTHCLLHLGPTFAEHLQAGALPCEATIVTKAVDDLFECPRESHQ